MFKAISLIALACCVISASVWSAPVKEDNQVMNGMSDAFSRGVARFGQGIESPRQNLTVLPSQPKIFSQYTANITALGGGKPALTEQYRQNKFMPYAPSVMPFEFPQGDDKLTPEAAAKIYVPQKPYQYSTDRLY